MPSSVDFDTLRWGRAFAPLVPPTRWRDVIALAARSPDAAANIAEMAIVKRGRPPARDVDGVDRERAKSTASSRRILRVVAWNVARGRHPDQWVTIDAVREADVLLLSEIDDGMARSGNLDIAAEIALRLDMHYAFVPNYFELTRGTRRERHATRGQSNARGFHGNAILSRTPLRDVRRVPLPVEFDWYRHYERRIGTRVALMATIDVGGEPCTLVVAHLEAFATPEQRCRQMRVLLDNLTDVRRVILGGDFNTLGLRPNWTASLRLLGERALDRDRLTRSVAQREPLFDAARTAGFSWEELNTFEATWQLNRWVPRALRAKLDWLLGRNVVPVVGSARVIAPYPVVSAPRSHRLSDHDGVAVNLLL